MQAQIEGAQWMMSRNTFDLSECIAAGRKWEEEIAAEWYPILGIDAVIRTVSGGGATRIQGM